MMDGARHHAYLQPAEVGFGVHLLQLLILFAAYEDDHQGYSHR